MPWYYVENGEQRGPVADADFDALLQAGKVTDDTLVWREGLPSWQPWREARPAPADALPPGAPPVSGLVCAECGKVFQPDQVIRLNDRWVCATCKPIYLQRIREGQFLGGGAATAGKLTEAQVRERDYEHDVGLYLSQAWQLFKSDPGNCIGSTLLVGICVVAIGLIPFPYGFALNLIFMGPLTGGLFLFYVKKLRNEPASVADAFSGFQSFGPLLLGHCVPTLLMWVSFIPTIVAAMALGFSSVILHRSGGAAVFSGLAPVMVVVLAVLVIGGFCAATYLQVCWVFTIWLIKDKKMSFWPAMGLSRAVVKKHWWQTLLVGIVAALVLIAGMVACCIGVLVTGPLMLGMYAFAYEKLFGDMQPAAD